MKKLLVFIITILMLAPVLYAQGELNASVRVNTPGLQRNDRRVFDQMEVALKEFLNNTKWTQDQFEPEERIECNFIFTISKEMDNNVFEAELAVQALRPVYGSNYKTPLISHLDKEVVFNYEQNQPIDFAPDAADNPNLSALLAFYSYLILGLDYDSFSLYGGESHLTTAQQLVTNVQNSNTNKSPGWRPGDGGKNRNRHWIIENLLNPRVKTYRAAMYTYHRKGLDGFSADLDQGKSFILQALEDVDKVNSAYFNSMIVQMFANAKRDELVEMWKAGQKTQRERIMQIMLKIDPANGNKYRELAF